MLRTATSDAAENRNDNEEHQKNDCKLIVENITNGHYHYEHNVIYIVGAESMVGKELHIPDYEERKGHKVVRNVEELAGSCHKALGPHCSEIYPHYADSDEIRSQK